MKLIIPPPVLFVQFKTEDIQRELLRRALLRVTNAILNHNTALDSLRRKQFNLEEDLARLDPEIQN